MKSNIPLRPSRSTSSASHRQLAPPDAITAGPPRPEVVDPAGPKEYQWPRGVFNFGNLVLAAGVLNMVAIVVLAALAHR